MLITYHRVQAIRVLVLLSQSPQFKNLGCVDKFLFWSSIAQYLINFAVEILLYADYWIEYVSEYGQNVVALAIPVIYLTSSVTHVCTGYNQALIEINFPIASCKDVLNTIAVPLPCAYVMLWMLNYDDRSNIFQGYHLAYMLGVPITKR